MVGTKMGMTPLVSSGTPQNTPEPNKILELMFCTCNCKCTMGWCPCADNLLVCTNTCTEQDCDNMMVAEEATEIDKVNEKWNNIKLLTSFLLMFLILSNFILSNF